MGHLFVLVKWFNVGSVGLFLFERPVGLWWVSGFVLVQWVCVGSVGLSWFSE